MQVGPGNMQMAHVHNIELTMVDRTLADLYTVLVVRGLAVETR